MPTPLTSRVSLSPNFQVCPFNTVWTVLLGQETENQLPRTKKTSGQRNEVILQHFKGNIHVKREDYDLTQSLPLHSGTFTIYI